MWEHLRRLTAEQRTLLVLRYFEDLALADIAKLLDKPLGTVNRVRRDVYLAISAYRRKKNGVTPAEPTGDERFD